MINARKRNKLRTLLEERRSEIEGSVSSMAEEIRDLGTDQDDENGSLGNHIADDGANVAEAERIVTVTEDLQDILAQVNGALERMDEGTYGICQRCGRPIGEERLEAFPYVAFCIECQSAIEREQALRAGG
jgi:DnaK suppressor protein